MPVRRKQARRLPYAKGACGVGCVSELGACGAGRARERKMKVRSTYRKGALSTFHTTKQNKAHKRAPHTKGRKGAAPGEVRG